jgi:exopolysaccharide production protein ExoQ
MNKVLVFFLLYFQFFVFIDIDLFFKFIGFKQEIIQTGVLSYITTPTIFVFYFLDLIFIIIYQKWLIGIFKKNIHIHLIFIICLISLTWIHSEMFSIGFSNSILLIGGYVQIITFTLIIHFSKTNALSFLKNISLIILILVVLYTMFYFENNFSIELEGRFQGFTTSPNNLAQLMNIIFIAWYNPMKIIKLNIPVISISILTVFFILLSGSATGLILIIITVLFHLFPKMNAKTSLKLVFIGVLSISVFAVFFLRTDETIRIGSIERNLTFTGRTKIWSNVTEKQIKDNKVLLGYGYKGFWDVKKGASNNMTDTFKENIQQSHNGFLELYLQFGVISIFIMFLFFKFFIHNFTHSKVLTLIAICFIINNFSESVFLQPRHALWKFTIFSLVLVSLINLIDNRGSINFRNAKN